MCGEYSAIDKMLLCGGETAAYPFEPPKMQFITKVWYVLRKIYIYAHFHGIFSCYLLIIYNCTHPGGYYPPISAGML